MKSTIKALKDDEFSPNSSCLESRTFSTFEAGIESAEEAMEKFCVNVGFIVIMTMYNWRQN